MKKIHILFIISILAASCEKKDFNYVQPEPKTAYVDATATGRRQIPNGRIRFDVTLQAASGIKAVVVKANGTEVKSEDLTPKNELFLTYNVDYTVPTSAKQGDKIALTVETIDLKDRPSAPITYTIDVVGSTFTVADVVVAGQTLQQISGIINVDFEIPAAGRVLLNGRVEVEEGITLTIRPGAILYGKFGTPAPSYLSVRPKGIIRAIGIKDAPIVMTSERTLTNNAASGDWGGLVLNGQARVNTADFTFTGVTGKYGGTIDTDNSGIIEYVRVEFGGGGTGINELEPANVTLNGVGSATTVRFVQSFNSNGLGFYINGGRVNLRNIVSMNSPSHEFNAERGWRGLGQFWLAHTTRAGERGIQISTYPVTPETFVVSECAISNVTLVGPGFGQPASFANIGIRIRRAARAKIYNALVTQYPSAGVRIDPDLNAEYTSGQALLAHSNLFQNSAGTAHANNFHSSTRAEWRDKPAANNAVTVVPLTQNFVGTSTTAPFAATMLGAFFTAANYRGAVLTGTGDWTADGTWCKNADGTVR